MSNTHVLSFEDNDAAQSFDVTAQSDGTTLVQFYDIITDGVDEMPTLVAEVTLTTEDAQRLANFIS